MYSNLWNDFFGNPILSQYLTEAEEYPQEGIPEDIEPSEDSPGGSISPEEIQQLAADLKEGHLNQDDLIQMYKSGKLSKESIEQIINQAEGEGQEDQAPTGDTQEAGEPQPTEEELFSQQIDQTNDMFIKFALYDKTSELIDKLNYFKDNFDDMQSDTYNKVVQLREFLNILSNLIFSIETTVSYQMYGSILLQLTEIFNEYNNEEQSKEVQDKIKDRINEDFRDGSKTVDPVENWSDDNQSHKMPDNSKYQSSNSATRRDSEYKRDSTND